MLLNGAYASNLKLGGNLELLWYSCNILRYCSNRCMVWFFIPANFRPKLTESFPFNYMLKSKFSLSRHFEYANEQITYHFWLWHEIPQKFSRLPPLCAIFLSAPPNLNSWIRPCIPRSRVDIGFSGWYGKGHLLISILKISISSDIQFNKKKYLIIIVLNHLSIRKFKFLTWRTRKIFWVYFIHQNLKFIGYKLLQMKPLLTH